MICKHYDEQHLFIPFLGYMCPLCHTVLSTPMLLEGVVPARSLRELCEQTEAEFQLRADRLREKAAMLLDPTRMESVWVCKDN